MGALQQGRAVFNPLPLAEHQNPDLVPRVQAIAKDAYSRLVALDAPATTVDCQNRIQGDHYAKLKKLINSLNCHKSQGLLWTRDLETKTSQYWSTRVKDSKFSEFLDMTGHPNTTCL